MKLVGRANKLIYIKITNTLSRTQKLNPMIYCPSFIYAFNKYCLKYGVMKRD